MTYLRGILEMDSCPHCGKANPTLSLNGSFLTTKDHKEQNDRWWGFYICNSCGGIVTASAPRNPPESNRPHNKPITEIYPNIPKIDVSIPDKPREFLRQAQSSLNAPSGAIMLSASAIDAILKEKGYIDGSLYERIEKAATDHLITKEMSKWAHQVRLDANEQRHADEDVGLPNENDAKLTFDFAMAFAEYLFVLPSRVTRGIANAKGS